MRRTRCLVLAWLLLAGILMAESPVDPRDGNGFAILVLDVPQKARESVWSEALADVLDGEEEVSVTIGRADILTDHYVVEVDRFRKFHEGIGQAIHYRVETGKEGVLALMVDKGQLDLDRANYLYHKLCRPIGLRLLILVSADTLNADRKRALERASLQINNGLFAKAVD
ncbi:MAG: hypothetical protein ACFE0O_08430 [Opitutales bacterium]